MILLLYFLGTGTGIGLQIAFGVFKNDVSLIGMSILFLIMALWGFLVMYVPKLRFHNETTTIPHTIFGMVERLAFISVILCLPPFLQWVVIIPAIILYKKYKTIVRPGFFLTGEYSVALFFGIPTLILYDLLVISGYIIHVLSREA
jgi:hypothetical protein